MLKKIDSYLAEYFPRLGINKNREIKRLLFEIAKRDKLKIETIVDRKIISFEQLKTLLLKKRYPLTSKTHKKENFYLMKGGLNNGKLYGALYKCR